jgi:isocitrate lyase
MKTTEKEFKISYRLDYKPRWNGIERPYTAEEVVKLQGSYQIEHSVARIGANALWWLNSRIL